MAHVWRGKAGTKPPGPFASLCVSAIEQIADRFSAGRVQLVRGATLDRVEFIVCGCFRLFGGAAFGAAVGEAWLVRLQLKFFPTHYTGFFGKRHSVLHDLRLTLWMGSLWFRVFDAASGPE